MLCVLALCRRIADGIGEKPGKPRWEPKVYSNEYILERFLGPVADGRHYLYHDRTDYAEIRNRLATVRAKLVGGEL